MELIQPVGLSAGIARKLRYWNNSKNSNIKLLFFFFFAIIKMSFYKRGCVEMIQQKVLKRFVIFAAILFVLPISVKAYNLDNVNIVTMGEIKSFAKTTSTSAECESSANTDTVLGSVDCEESVAWLLQKILNYIKVLGPSLAIVLSAIDFTKVIVSSNNDSMKKTQQKFINRLIAAVLLFFIPTLTEVILKVIGITGSTAGLK